MDPRNRSVWLWLGVALCTTVGALFGVMLGVGSERTVAGVLIGTFAGFAVGIYGARKSMGK